MKREELEAIEAREAVATPGPWEQDRGLEVYTHDKRGYFRLADIRGWGHLTGQGALALPKDEAIAIQTANAEFIAHSRQDVPALLAEVKRLNAELERMNGEYDSAVADLETLLGEIDNCLVCGPSPSGNVRKIRKKTV